MSQSTSFQTQTRDELIDQVRQDIESEFPGVDPWTQVVMHQGRPLINPTYVFGEVVGEGLYQIQCYLDFLATQVLPDTARGAWLERWAGLVGITRKPATQATGLLLIQGTDGTAVPAGTVFQTVSGGQYNVTNPAASTAGAAQYKTLSAAIIGQSDQAGSTVSSPGSTLVLVESVIPGAAYNLPPFARLDLSGGITGIAANGHRASELGISQGTDLEGDRFLRQRLLERLRRLSTADNEAAYVNWALSLPGVTRAWAYGVPVAPMGFTVVQFMMDATYSDGIPQPGDIAAMHTHLQALKPGGAGVMVVPLNPQPIDLSIQGLTPSDSLVVGSVRDFVADTILTRGRPAPPFFPGSTVGIGSFSRSWLGQAVSNATGEDRHILSLPSRDVAINYSHIPTLGNINIL